MVIDIIIVVGHILLHHDKGFVLLITSKPIGWQAAVREADKWVNSWAIIASIKVSRLDITVDLMGDFPVLSPELTEVVTRTKKKKEFGNYERYTDGAIRTGYRFGENELMCRIYDKTREIIRSEKIWFKPMWAENGWVEGETIIRVEFQCGRKLIIQMGIKSIEDMIRVVPGLWKYLTEEWLTIRVIGNDSHRTRWAISEVLDYRTKVCGVVWRPFLRYTHQTT